MRVLLISHTCQSASEGLPKAEQLGRLPGVDLCVLVPDRWCHYGQWRLAAPRPRGASYRLEVGRVRLPWVKAIGYYLHHYPGLERLVREFRPDVIDLWEEPYGLVSAQACRVRRRVAPDALVLTETEQNINKRLPFPFERFRSAVLAQADWAVARSEGALNVLRAKGYQGQATVVPNAVDTEVFRPLDRSGCRQKLGLSDDRYLVGFAGRLVPEKGVEDLLAAVALCPADVSLVVAGDGPLRPALERAAGEADLSGRVTFLGEVPSEDLPTVMNAIDVLALPSRTTPRWKEQFGRVIIEAHACERPVIGTTSGAIPHVVGHGGRVVPERSPQALAAAIGELHADPDLGRRLGVVGRAEAHVTCTWEQVALQMRDVYRQMLDGRASRPAPAARPVRPSVVGRLT